MNEVHNHKIFYFVVVHLLFATSVSFLKCLFLLSRKKAILSMSVNLNDPPAAGGCPPPLNSRAIR